VYSPVLRSFLSHCFSLGPSYHHVNSRFTLLVNNVWTDHRCTFPFDQLAVFTRQQNVLGQNWGQHKDPGIADARSIITRPSCEFQGTVRAETEKLNMLHVYAPCHNRCLHFVTVTWIYILWQSNIYLSTLRQRHFVRLTTAAYGFTLQRTRFV